MGLLDFLRTPLNLAAVSVPVQLGTPYPAPTSNIQQVFWSEYFGGELTEVTRQSALQVPAIKKARDVLVSTIAGLPLREFEGDVEVEQPWLRNSATGVSPWHRMATIVDDLLFYDWSLLAVERDPAGQITDSVRVPIERWSADSDGTLRVDGKKRNAAELVLIPGSGSGGLLSTGATTIKGYRAMERAWVGRAQNPIPLLNIQQVTDDELTDDEIDDIVTAWSAARMSPTGAVGFSDRRVKLEALGEVSTDLFEEGRNAAVLDAARLTGVPASILDGSQSTATLTYSTTEGKRSEFDDYSLPPFLDPIEARLSLDDVAASGRVIRFDRSSRTAVEAPAINQPQED